MADTTPTLREAAQQALEALESLQGGCTDSGDGTTEAITVWCPEVITALRAALAEQAEPGSWRSVGSDDGMRHPEACDLVGGETDMPAEQAEPVGVTPVEVTPEMLKAGAAEWLKYGEYEAQFPLAQGFDKLPRHLQVGLSRATHVYRAMRAAAPPAPARQEPLTEEQVRRGWSSISLHPHVSRLFIEGVLFAERAHGITAAPAEGGAA